MFICKDVDENFLEYMLMMNVLKEEIPNIVSGISYVSEEDSKHFIKKQVKKEEGFAQ